MSANPKYERLEILDRCAVFERVGIDESGAEVREKLVATGDGEALPYRSFINKAVFDLAAGYLFSPHSTVTALDPKKLAGLVGAMLARQSRIPGTVVDVLVKEFLVSDPKESEEMGIPIGEIKAKKLEGIIERILIQYGDDSVQELECATVLFNSVSNLAAKIIEDRRLAGFIEQSSRYVLYTERDPVTGWWMYLREQRIMASPHADEYVRVMDRCFETYAKLAEELTKYYQTVKPLAETTYAIKPGDDKKYRLDELTDEKEIKEFNRVYKFDLKTKACDTARIVLPAATITNLAMVANGRSFEHLLKRLYSSGNPEYVDLGNRLHDTLNKFIPKYVKRANPSGEGYMIDTERRAREQMLREFPEFCRFARSAEEVAWLELPELVSDTPEAVAHLLANSYFPHARVPFSTIVARLLQEPKDKLVGFLKEILGERASRRDRAGRAFEHGYPATFELVGNFGIFRDLHRHRILTQQRQLLNPHLGFTVPDDVEAIGMGDEVRALEAEIRALYDKLDADLGPEAAQYCVTFGHHIRFMMGYSLRESQHLNELRTIPQGHPDYRRVCQKMHLELVRRAPWLGEIGLLKFVDHNDYPWSRAAAEAKQSAKRLKLGVTDE
jgi:thymidylate synthase ThyX